MLEVGFTATRLREDLNTVNEAESSGFSSRALWIKGYRRYHRPHILAHATFATQGSAQTLCSITVMTDINVFTMQ